MPEPNKFFKRAIICFATILGVLMLLYVSLAASATPLDIEQKHLIRRATSVIKSSGFSNEAFLLENLTIFRGTDNWLNASVAKENAYAATNFPFEIMTIYSDFFAYPIDDVERAAILLHEAQHLKGKDEHDAYEFVWRNRDRLGWTREKYGHLPVWQNIRKQTRDNAPELFTCEGREYGDCTEAP